MKKQKTKKQQQKPPKKQKNKTKQNNKYIILSIYLSISKFLVIFGCIHWHNGKCS